MSTAQPTPVKKTFFTPELLENPYPIYYRLREEGPMHYLDRGGTGPGFWGIFRYSDCAALFRDPKLSASRSAGMFAAIPAEYHTELAPLRRMLSQWMLLLDPPQHSRLRKLLNKGFSPAAIEALSGMVESSVEEMLAPLGEATEAEIMSQVAHQVPVRVIAKMLGIEHVSQTQLMAWSDALAVFLGNPARTIEVSRAAQDAVLALIGFFKQVVKEHRGAKGNNLISLLLEIEADGDVLTEDELYAQCVMLLFAGHETTRNLIGNGMLTLLKQPAAAERLREQPELIRPGVEELLRYESPVQNITRILKEDMEICGQALPKGSVAMMMLGSANRDPDEFDEPDLLDLGRKNNSHLAFGVGAHFCIGNQLARMEAQAAILQLVQKFPKIQFAGQAPEWVLNFTLRGLKSLPVSL